MSPLAINTERFADSVDLGKPKLLRGRGVFRGNLDDSGVDDPQRNRMLSETLRDRFE